MPAIGRVRRAARGMHARERTGDAATPIAPMGRSYGVGGRAMRT